jgi:hypothetical protein
MTKLSVAICLTALALAPTTAVGQVSIGGQGSWGDKTDFGVGARATLDLTPEFIPVALIGTYDWFFPEDPPGEDLSYWEANANVVYVQRVYEDAVSYVGAGLNVATLEREILETTVKDSSTELGVNLVGGIRYKFTQLMPFFELRYEISGGEQFVLTAGIELIFGNW